MTDYQLIAHRGYSAVTPENTLASFQASIEKQVFGVEFDVHLTTDDTPVVIHDSTLERTTNGEGKVAEKTLSELRSLDAGSWFNSKFIGEKIPTLEQVLDLFSPTSITLYVEVKSPTLWSKQGKSNLIELIKAKIDRCVIISFDHDFLHQLQQQCPQLTCGYGISKATQYCLEYVATLPSQYKIILPHFPLIFNAPDMTKTLQNQGWELIPWTVDEPKIGAQLKALNLVKIITNNLLIPTDKVNKI